MLVLPHKSSCSEGVPLGKTPALNCYQIHSLSMWGDPSHRPQSSHYPSVHSTPGLTACFFQGEAAVDSYVEEMEVECGVCMSRSTPESKGPCRLGTG